jgi:hypothetical protein
MRRPQSSDNNLWLKVPDLDLLISCSAQPVTVGGEAKAVDDLTSIKTVETLALVQVPEHSGTVLTTRSTEGSIRGYAYGVKVSGVSDEVVAELAVGQIPNLDKTVPSAGYNEWYLYRRAETYAGYPFAVSVSISHGVDGVLALSKGVPKLDGLISGSTDNLTVVNRESNREDILGVTYETTSGLSGVDLPETEGSVPRSGKSKLSVRGDDNIGYEVVVSAKSTTGVSVRVALSFLGRGGGVGECPYHDGLITGRGEDKVGVLGGGSDGGYPVSMAGKGSAENKSFGHGCYW